MLRLLGRLREPVNGLTHLAGAVLAVIALIVLVVMAIRAGRVEHLIAFGIFGVSLIALYTASALYHLLPLSERGLRRLRRLDHMMIFVLIAGTYTPVCVVALGGGWGWGLLGTILGLALGGILLKLRWMHAPVWLSTAFYALMGWIAVIAAPALFEALPTRGIAWIIAGGLIYTVGAVIFLFDRPRPDAPPRLFGPHELWHIFVLAGSFCHFWVMFRYIAPLA